MPKFRSKKKKTLIRIYVSESADANIEVFVAAWKVSKYGTLLGPYFLVFEPNTARTRENTDQKKLHIWTPFTQYGCYDWAVFC